MIDGNKACMLGCGNTGKKAGIGEVDCSEHEVSICEINHGWCAANVKRVVEPRVLGVQKG